MGMDFTAYFAFEKDDLTQLVKNLNDNIDMFPLIYEFVEDLLEYNPKDRD